MLKLKNSARIKSCMSQKLEIGYYEQFSNSSIGIKLSNFLKDNNAYHKASRDKHVVVCDQAGKNYAFPRGDPIVKKFTKYLNDCVNANFHLHFAERQYYVDDNEENVTHSGIMIDLDFQQPTPKRHLTDRRMQRIAKNIVKTLSKLIDYGFDKMREKILMYHVIFICKPEIVPLEKGYKDGCHILIPAIQVTKQCKRLLLKMLLENKAIEKEFKGVQFLNSYDDIIDKGASHVPVYFIGSSKPNKTPYVLKNAYLAVVDEHNINIEKCNTFDKVKEMIGRPKREVYVQKNNLVLEFSLHYQGNIIRKYPYDLKKEYDSEPEITDSFEDERNAVYGELSTAVLQDVDIAETKELLSILSHDRLHRYQSWRNVIIALASAGPQFYTLAVWISMTDENKWKMGNNGVSGEEELKKLWSIYCVKSNKDETISLRSIDYWAKQDNPEKYREIKDGTAFSILCSSILKYGASLPHAAVAEVLFKMIGKKFVAAVIKGKVEWYEFVLPTDKSEEGTVYKYRYVGLPFTLKDYLYKNLSKMCKRVVVYIKDRLEQQAVDEDQQKYYVSCRKAMNSTMRNLGMDGFQEMVIKQLTIPCADYNFANKLDKLPYVIGVNNGVLLLGKTPKLIDTYHEYAISKHCNANYVPYDANNPYIREIEDIIKDIIIEDDARDFIVKYFASTLDFAPKDSLIFFWFGLGSNAKSFITELHKETLGEDYGGKLPFAFLCDRQKNSSNADPALMTLEYAHWTYFSETHKGTVIYMPRIKEVTGDETLSGRNLFEKQRQFKPMGHYTAAFNNNVRVEGTDHGTWRRILYYIFKMKFTDEPDPDNPLEKKDDKPRIDKIKMDKNGYYKQAWLSILVKHYIELQQKYSGQLMKVPHPTIKKETLEYRNSQDTLNRFITIRLRYNENADNIKLLKVASAYQAWHLSTINKEDRIIVGEIVESLSNSSIRKFITRNSFGIGWLTKHDLLFEDCMV